MPRARLHGSPRSPRLPLGFRYIRETDRNHRITSGDPDLDLFTMDDYVREAREPYRLVVLRIRGGRPVALAFFILEGERLVVERLVRDRGLPESIGWGAELLKIAEKVIAPALSVRELALEARNDRLRDWYASKGFVVAGTKPSIPILGASFR